MIQMKKILIFILLFVCMNQCVFADEETFEIIDEYAKVYGSEIQEATGKLKDVDFEELVPGFDVDKIVSSLAKGENIFSVQGILNKGIGILAGEIRNTLKILVFILALGLLCTYLTNIQNSFGSKSVSDAAFFVCYMVIVGIASAVFFQVIGCGKTLVSNLSLFMRTMAPVALVTLTASGAIISATSFELMFMGVIEIAELLLETVFIPLILITAALSMVNNLSQNLNAEKLVQFMNKTTKWGIGIVMTVFVGVMGLQGIVAGSADGLTVKVTKFAAGNLIPLVGGALSETVETVMNCSVVIKNAVGVAGIIMVVLIVAVPVIKVAACLIMFRLSAALLQPVCDKRIVKCISELADSMSAVFGLMMVVSVMFVIMITIIINVGSSAALLGR